MYFSAVNTILTNSRHDKTNFGKYAYKAQTVMEQKMAINIQAFLEKCGIKEPMYPGKRLVHKLPQPGEHKSHSIVYDWRNPETLRMEVKAGLSGHDLMPKEQKKYPLSFQSPTYVEFKMFHMDEMDMAQEDTDEDEEGKEGRAGGGSRMPRKRIHAFSEVMRGRIPDAAEIKKLVVMGKEIAQGACEMVLESLAAQIKNLTVAPVNLLAAVTKVTKVAPGGRMKADIDPSLLQGAKPYKPQPDMFGPPVT